MTRLLSASTFLLDRQSRLSTSTSSVPFEAGLLHLTVADVLGRDFDDPVAPNALAVAAIVFPQLQRALSAIESRTAVSEAGEAVLTFVKGRRHAVMTADADGELVLTLSDRASADEAHAEIVRPPFDSLPDRLLQFLER